MSASLPVSRGLPFAQSSVDKFMEQMHGTPRAAKQSSGADTPGALTAAATAAPYTPSAAANATLSTSMLGVSMSAEPTTQMMCEGCCFCVAIPTSSEEILRGRFEARCPMNHVGAEVKEVLTEHDAISSLTQQGWTADEASKIMSSVSVSGGLVEKAHFERALDSSMRGGGVLSQGDLEARQLRKVIAIFRGTVVTQKGAPSPVQWHEQACEHFGLRGLVRIAVRGLVVEIGIIVEGQEADVKAYTHSVKNGDATKGASDMAIRVLSSAGSEKGFAELTVVTHESKEALEEAHRHDVLQRNASFASSPSPHRNGLVSGSPGRDSKGGSPAPRKEHMQSPQKVLSTIRTPRSPPQKAASKSSAPTAAAAAAAAPSHEESRRHSPLSASVLSATIHPAPTASSDSRRAPLDDTDSSEGERGADWGIGSKAYQGARPPSSSEHKPRQATNGRSPSASTVQHGGRPVSYEALFAYEAREPDELGVAPGEVLEEIQRHDDGWILARNSAGASGMVPGNYLRIIENAASSQSHPQIVRGGGSGGGGGGLDAIDDALLDVESACKVLDEKLLALEQAAPRPAGKGESLGGQQRDFVVQANLSIIQKNVASAKGAMAEIRDIVNDCRDGQRSAMGSSRKAAHNLSSASRVGDGRGGESGGGGGRKAWRYNGFDTSSDSEDGLFGGGRRDVAMRGHGTSGALRGEDADREWEGGVGRRHRVESESPPQRMAPAGYGGGGTPGAGQRFGDVSREDVASIAHNSSFSPDSSPAVGVGARGGGGGGPGGILSRGDAFVSGPGASPSREWRVAVKIEGARDLPVDTDAGSIYCCISLVKAGGRLSVADMVTWSPFEHVMGGAPPPSNTKACCVEPLHQSDECNSTPAPEWGQEFSMSHSYGLVEQEGRFLASTHLQKFEGWALLLLLSIHRREPDGRASFVGRCAVEVPPENVGDSWVVLRGSTGQHLTGRDGRLSAVHLRFAYQRRDVLVGGDDAGFWA